MATALVAVTSCPSWGRAGKLRPASERGVLKATHRGSFKEDFGIDVECYVLNDERKTAVISQRGMGAALKMGAGGRDLPKFLSGRIISEFVGDELRERLAKPIYFQGPTVVANTLFCAASTRHANLVQDVGIEPTTCLLEGGCSIH